VADAQANVFELPFRGGTFDFIFSLGVLHHTPDKGAAFDRLLGLVRTNGRIASWLYSNYGGWRPSELYRYVTPRLPKRLLHCLTYDAVPLYYVHKIPVVGPLLSSLTPISHHPKARRRVLDTFDWYSPKYQWKHAYEEVIPWFEQQGLTDIRVLGSPIAFQGTKR
jgi:SAM-dependent methyltransferase